MAARRSSWPPRKHGPAAWLQPKRFTDMGWVFVGCLVLSCAVLWCWGCEVEGLYNDVGPRGLGCESFCLGVEDCREGRRGGGWWR